MRVTHVVFDLHGGGMERLVASIVRRFAGTPVHCSLVTLSGRPGRIGAELAPLLDQFHVLAPIRGVSMLAPVGLVRALRNARPDVVHLHSGAWFKGALAARLAGVSRVVFTEHGRIHNDPWASRQLDRLAAWLTDAVIPVSRPLEDYLHDRLGIPARRLRLIENGVDTEAFSPGPQSAGMRKRFNVPPDAQVIGSVGRLEPVKGYERLLSVFAALRRCGGQRADRWRLVLCGEGSERANLEALADQLGIRGSVTFPGWVDATAEVYRCFDIFAVTSRSEGLSISLLEAMACGVAPVVDDVGANREVLGAELAQYCVPEDAWDDFADLTAGLLSQPPRRAEAAVKATARVRERYSLDRVVAQYLEVYQGSGPRPSEGLHLDRPTP